MTPRRFAICGLLVLGLAASACGRYGTSYAAVVGGRPITFVQLQRAVDEQRAGAQEPGPATVEAQRQVLMQLIQRQLLASEERRHGIRVSDRDVDDRLANVKALFASTEEYQQALAQQGLDEARLRENLRSQIAFDRLQERVVPVSISEADLRRAYQEQVSALTRVHARHILFAVSKQTAAQALAKARAALAEIRGGADFGAVAKRLSDDVQSKATGGDLDTQPASGFVPSFAQAVQTLPLGKVSEPVKSQFGYHLIQVLQRTVTSFAQVRDEIRRSIVQEKTAAAFRDYFVGVIQRADIEVNPRIGDLNPETLQIVDHRFFVPSTPEPEPSEPGAPFGDLGFEGSAPPG